MDELDGWGNLSNTANFVYDKIYDIDGYHPVSLVLNCQDYEFEAYTTGTDIVMQDVYMTGINTTRWCEIRNAQFGNRSRTLGWERTKAIWAVSQVSGGNSYGSRILTEKECMVQSLLAVTHSALAPFFYVHL